MSLNDQTKRFHYFHAHATALGGHLEKPVPQAIAPQASLVLPVVGGHGAALVERFRLDGIVSFDAAYTQVSGTAASKNGPWSTMAMAVIEGLNVLNVFTADRIVAQIATEHPADGYHPRVTFAGTQFKNVHIAGSPVTIDVDLDICKQDPDKGFPQKACVRDENFLARVKRQCNAINARNEKPKPGERGAPELGAGEPGAPETTPVADWVRERYKWDDRTAGNDFVVCSIVNGIGGKFSGNASGHIFEVPHFGRGFLGELILSGGTYRLIMFRLELGCANQGMLSGVDTGSNGSTNP